MGKRDDTKNIMDTAIDGLLKICEVISVALLVILVVCTVLQVFFRFVLNNALVWSEEVSRFAGIWMVILSTAIAIHKRSHMTIDLFTGKLPQIAQNICKSVSDFVILMVCVCMLWYGSVMVTMFSGTPAPATRVSMGIIYAGIVVGWVCSTLVALFTFIKGLKDITKKTELEER